MLDSNTVLSALLFPRGRLVWIPPLWRAGSILPLVCGSRARELIDALAYPKFRLGERDIQTVLAAYLPFTEAVDVHDRVSSIPRCRDPNDQVFLRLAAVGQAQVLATGDRAILEIAEPLPFVIETAAEFRKRFT